jgi:hypothetical protein
MEIRRRGIKAGESKEEHRRKIVEDGQSKEGNKSRGIKGESIDLLVLCTEARGMRKRNASENPLYVQEEDLFKYRTRGED